MPAHPPAAAPSALLLTTHHSLLTKMTFRLVPGQRWYSTAEPELGLGTIKKVDQRALELLFTKAGMLRRYALTSAPLSRAEFRVGDQIAADGVMHTVEEVEDRDGLMHYRSNGAWISEPSNARSSGTNRRMNAPSGSKRSDCATGLKMRK